MARSQPRSQTGRVAGSRVSGNAGSVPVNKRKGNPRLLIFLLILLMVVLSPFLLVYFITESQSARIYESAGEVPPRPVALVFGAGLNQNGLPSPILADRVDAGIELYKSGKVKKLLMTGDGIGNNEVNAMEQYAMRRGVPVSAITKDSGGLRTYDSCWRAAKSYGISSAILVTQAYHLPRALYLCNSLGVDSVGLKAGRERYPGQDYYNGREFLAILGSWVDVNISRPTPEASKD